MAEPSVSHLESDPTGWWNEFTAGLAAGIRPYSEPLADDVVACIRSGEVHPLVVADKILDFLRTEKSFASLMAAAEANDTGKIAQLAISGTIAAAFSSRLARFLLANFVVPSPALELLLTQARRAILLRFIRNPTEAHDSATHAFVAALAQQCFLTEYAYWEEADETSWVDVLLANAEAMVEDKDANADMAVAVFACYRPLVPWLGEGQLTLECFPTRSAEFDEMWARLVADRLEEIELAGTFPTLSTIEDLTSQAVRVQYEENPYPRWRLPFLPKTMPAADAAAGLFPNGDMKAYRGGSAPRVLIAGCGTGFMTNTLARLVAGAEITAIDLSRASLSYAARQSRALGHKINYANADILALPASLGLFDIIECGGVLHHTGDVKRSWRALCEHLAPGGLMKVALYNRNGRDWVHPPRRLAQTGGYRATAKDMRRFRRDLTRAAMQPGVLPSGLQGIFTRPDFYTLSMCRDACFHVQEFEFSLREITTMAEELGLCFLGLSLPDEVTLANYHRHFPEDPFVRDVRLFEVFEQRAKDAAGSMYSLLLQKPA